MASIQASDEPAALSRARRASRLLDSAVRVPGTDSRVGLDPLVGLLPVAGDAVAAVCSLYVVFEAFRAGAPTRLLGVMLGVVAVDFFVGSVPVVGALFDAVWKANEWNVGLLQRHLDATA